MCLKEVDGRKVLLHNILCEVKVQTHVFNSIDLRFYHGLYVLVGIV